MNYQNDAKFLDAWLRWGKGPVHDQLQGLLCGDTKEVNVLPEIPALRNGVTRTITKAWLTIKGVETAADPTENAAFTAAGGMLSITTTEVAGRGEIINSAEGSPELQFDLTAANTALLTPHKTYHCAIQVKMSDGALYETERFTFDTRQQVTIATT
jgi:hypothetical protein